MGVQGTYSKTELVLLQKEVSFSIEKDQSFQSLEKELQPNVGFLKEKAMFVTVQYSHTVNSYNLSKGHLCEVAKEGDGLIKRLDELNLSVLTKKLDDLGDATKAKFFDDFADASDDALIALNNKTDLINYWKTNGNFFKNKTYSGSNVDWATTKNAIESGTNNTNKAILEAIEDRVLIEPLTGSKPVMAGAYCPELGGDVIVKYNLTTAEKVTFNYNNLEPVIKDQIDYMNLIRQDALDGGNLYEKLYTGVTKNKIIAAGDAASHAEVLALDALIKEMKIAGIYSSKADLSKISVLVKGKGSWGNMCRCPHCFHLTDGVNMIGH
ncbi:hypothetical protein [Tenacibaculum maritimum]|uniref:hypothetical protein n=2 Tax=Tenacibaculum maritimum TaxID=107401 RepID=UPI003875B5EA